MDDLVQRLGHVTYEAEDLDRAVDEFTRTGHLTLGEIRDGEVFLRGDMHHYWLRLVAGQTNRFVRVGYEVPGPEQLDEICGRLERRGVAVKSCDDAVASDRVERWVRFVDDNGIEVELFVHMLDAPTRTVAHRVRLTDMLHAVFLVPDVPATAAFYNETMGFKVSDWTERVAAFMRAGNGYHHSIAFLASPGANAGKFHHFAMLCEDIDDVMVARNDAVQCGVELAEDLVRHAASGSIGVYLRSPLGFAYEFCVWHQRITDPDHRPRILPAARSTVNVWELPSPPRLN